MDSINKYVTLHRFFVVAELLILVALQLASSCDNDEDNIIAVRERGGYMSFASALSEFTDPKFQNDDSIQGLLRVYRTNCPMYFGKYGDRHVSSRHIFIVVEGTHRITRNIVSNKLAAKLNAKHLHSPPTFMTRTKLIYNDTTDMKRAFFMMGIYGTAHNVRDMVSEFPVISSGYYVDQIAFSVAGAFQSRLPNRSSVVYQWPKDLLKPDIMFFVNTPSQLSKKTIDPDTFRGRIVQIYRNWKQPPLVVEVNNTHLYSGMVDFMMYNIKAKLGYDGSPIAVAPTDDINYCFYGDYQHKPK